MTDDTSRVPKLRFPGFAGAWEQRKAAEIFKSISDKNHPELSVLSASQKLGMIHRDDIGVDIKYDKKSIAGYKRVEPGQFVIHLRSFQGGFAYANVEGITSPAYTVLDFVDKNENDPLFWRIVLTSTDFIKRLETVTYGIRDGRSISFADFSTLKFNVPTFEEQRTIGKFFKKIDLTITLHQRKLSHLRQLKKGLLQKMFPKSGEDRPEVRFPGFVDAWEQREFKTLYKKVSEKNDLTISKNCVISVAQMRWGRIPKDSTEEYMRSYNILRVGDIAFEGNRSKKFAFGRFVENTIGTGLVSHVFDVFRPIESMDLGFWKYYIHDEAVMRNILRKSTQKSTMMTNLVSNDFMRQQIRVPESDEQQQIGVFFKQLDKTIALHQRKLSHLQQQKKALLQQMFV